MGIIYLFSKFTDEEEHRSTWCRIGLLQNVAEPVFDTPQQVGDSDCGLPNLLGVFCQESAFQNV